MFLLINLRVNVMAQENNQEVLLTEEMALNLASNYAAIFTDKELVPCNPTKLYETDGQAISISKANIHFLQDETNLPQNDIKSLKEIETPVLTVLGLGENCDKFNIQIKTKYIIEKQGYKVLSIFSNPLGAFLDGEILPGFLYSKSLSFPEKIKMFNFWIYDLQEKYKPDIIVIGCPSGIAELDRKSVV